MFCSQLLLAKKGALGVVWLAAHCHKMLKKEQVQQTNISASVDKILNDEAQTFTYRILAFLLLGVVRIYSKKVEYLLNDSQKIVNKLNEVGTTRSKSRSVNYLQSNYKSIALPARFELDAFDLELSGDQDMWSGNLRSRKKVSIAGGCRKENDTRASSKDKMPVSPASSYTPLKDVLSPHHAHRDVFASSVAGGSTTLSGSETHHERRFSLEEERHERMDLGEAEDEETHHEADEDPGTSPQNLTTDVSRDTYTDVERSFEIARGPMFNLDERFEPLILGDEENELITNGKSSSHEDVNINIQSPVEFAESPLPQSCGPVSSLGILEKSLLSSDHGCILMEGNLKSMAIPIVELPDMQAGETTAEVSVIKTPATNEPRPKSSSRKRKMSINQTIVVSNQEYTSWRTDTSNITRKRKVVPDTFRRAWMSRRLDHMPESLLEPVIPGDSIKLGSLGIIKSPTVVTEPVETSANQDRGHASPLDFRDFEENMDVRVPHELSTSQQLNVVDENLTTRLDAQRSEETIFQAETHVFQPTSSFEGHPQLSLSEGPAWDEPVSHEDSISLEVNSGAGKGDVFSARTRMIGEYLSRKFLEKKQKRKGGDQALNMSQLLERKTKKDSARLFYEILVLKSRDCIDVQQDNAYDDILLRETPKLAEMSGT